MLFHITFMAGSRKVVRWVSFRDQMMGTSASGNGTLWVWRSMVMWHQIHWIRTSFMVARSQGLTSVLDRCRTYHLNPSGAGRSASFARHRSSFHLLTTRPCFLQEMSFSKPPMVDKAGKPSVLILPVKRMMCQQV